MKNQIDILGIKINTDFEEDILEIIEKYIKSGKRKAESGKFLSQKPLVIFTPNPEIVMYAQHDQQFKQIVNCAQINIPDGEGLVWAGNIMGQPIRERISGADLMQKLIVLAGKEQATIGLIGGFGDLALKTLECLKNYHPGLKGWGEAGPRVKCQMSTLPAGRQDVKCQMDCGSWDIDEFIKRVKEKKTRILFVGFGAPKQEYFINEIAPKLSNIVLMAVGGTFDFLSGRIPRAPKWMQNLGLEWLYRLVREPWRIKRQIVGSKFFIKILLNKMLNPKSKAQMSNKIQKLND